MLMIFLEILAWVFGVLFSFVVLRRIYFIVKEAISPGKKTDEELRSIGARNGFLFPLIIAIICWVFIIACYTAN